MKKQTSIYIGAGAGYHWSGATKYLTCVEQTIQSMSAAMVRAVDFGPNVFPEERDIVARMVESDLVILPMCCKWRDNLEECMRIFEAEIRCYKLAQDIVIEQSARDGSDPPDKFIAPKPIPVKQRRGENQFEDYADVLPRLNVDQERRRVAAIGQLPELSDASGFRTPSQWNTLVTQEIWRRTQGDLRLEVFLSSTHIDLADERAALSMALRELGHEVFNFSENRPQTLDPAAWSMKKARECGVYIGLANRRYNLSAGKKDSISLTEQEFKTATEYLKPRAFFIGKELPRGTREYTEMSKEEVDRLQAFIDNVQECEPEAFEEFSSVDDLTVKAITSLYWLLRVGSELFTLPPTDRLRYDAHPYALATDATVVRRQFTERLCTWWLGSGNGRRPRVLCINALGGMGKSAVTWHWYQNYLSGDVRRMWWSFYANQADALGFAKKCVDWFTRFKPVNPMPQPPKGGSVLELLDWIVSVLERMTSEIVFVFDGIERELLYYRRYAAARLTEGVRLQKNLEDTAAENAVHFGGDLSRAKRALTRFHDIDTTERRLSDVDESPLAGFLRRITTLRSKTGDSKVRVLMTTRFTPTVVEELKAKNLAEDVVLPGLDPDEVKAIWAPLPWEEDLLPDELGGGTLMEVCTETLQGYALPIVLLSELVNHCPAAGKSFRRWKDQLPRLSRVKPLVSDRGASAESREKRTDHWVVRILKWTLADVCVNDTKTEMVFQAVASRPTETTLRTLLGELVGPVEAKGKPFRNPADLVATLSKLRTRKLLGLQSGRRAYDMHPLIRRAYHESARDDIDARIDLLHADLDELAKAVVEQGHVRGLVPLELVEKFFPKMKDHVDDDAPLAGLAFFAALDDLLRYRVRCNLTATRAALLEMFETLLHTYAERIGGRTDQGGQESGETLAARRELAMAQLHVRVLQADNCLMAADVRGAWRLLRAIDETVPLPSLSGKDPLPVPVPESAVEAFALLLKGIVAAEIGRMPSAERCFRKAMIKAWLWLHRSETLAIKFTRPMEQLDRLAENVIRWASCRRGCLQGKAGFHEKANAIIWHWNGQKMDADIRRAYAVILRESNQLAKLETLYATTLAGIDEDLFYGQMSHECERLGDEARGFIAQNKNPQALRKEFDDFAAKLVGGGLGCVELELETHRLAHRARIRDDEYVKLKSPEIERRCRQAGYWADVAEIRLNWGRAVTDSEPALARRLFQRGIAVAEAVQAQRLVNMGLEFWKAAFAGEDFAPETRYRRILSTPVDSDDLEKTLDSLADVPQQSTQAASILDKSASESLRDHLELLKKSLDWDNTTAAVRNWWEMFETENRSRIESLVNLAERLRADRATITEFHSAFLYGNTEHAEALRQFMLFRRHQQALAGSRREKGDTEQRLEFDLDLPEGDSDKDRIAVLMEKAIREATPEANAVWSEYSKRGSIPEQMAFLAELDKRNATVAEFATNRIQGGTDSVRAALHHLDYSRLKREEDQKTRQKSEIQEKRREEERARIAANVTAALKEDAYAGRVVLLLNYRNRRKELRALAFCDGGDAAVFERIVGRKAPALTVPIDSAALYRLADVFAQWPDAQWSPAAHDRLIADNHGLTLALVSSRGNATVNVGIPASYIKAVTKALAASGRKSKSTSAMKEFVDAYISDREPENDHATLIDERVREEIHRKLNVELERAAKNGASPDFEILDDFERTLCRGRMPDMPNQRVRKKLESFLAKPSLGEVVPERLKVLKSLRTANSMTDLHPGMLFDGRYQLLKPLAGHTVWAAEKLASPNLRVAVKFVSTEVGRSFPVDRLRKEALTLVSCRHKFVLRLDDFHSFEGWHYLAMELATHGDIGHYTARVGGRVSWVQARHWWLQQMQALDFVHATGVVHAAVDPTHILLTSPAETRLGGFGSAILPGDESSPLTGARHLGPCVAPEVRAGAPPSAAADVYSLAAAIVQVASGRPLTPPAADRFSVKDIARHFGEHAPPDEDLLWLQACLANRPEDRPAAESFLNARPSLGKDFSWKLEPVAPESHDSTELTFVRCPSCRNLVPATAKSCRICGGPLKKSE